MSLGLFWAGYWASYKIRRDKKIELVSSLYKKFIKLYSQRITLNNFV